MARKLMCVIALALLIVLATGERQEAAGEQLGHHKQRYDARPFARDITQLPPGYLGHDIVPIYESLAGFPSPTESGPRGVHSSGLANSNLQGLLAFVCGQTTEDQAVTGTKTSYNADRQIMSVTFLPLTSFSSSLMHRSMVVFKEIKEREEMRQTENAANATVVKIFYEGHYGVASDDILHLSRDIEFPLSPESAREAERHIGILLVCRIKPFGDPPVYSLLESSLSYATPISPVETFYFQHFVGVELLEIWVFNRKTGTLYVKKQMKAQ